MFKPSKQIIVLLIAAALAIGASFAAANTVGLTTDKATAEAAATSDVLVPMPEALLPPIGPFSGAYRM
jgi:hypothetical protein